MRTKAPCKKSIMNNRIEGIIATKNKTVREKKEQALKKLIAKETLDLRGKKIEQLKREVELKAKLKVVSKIINLSYIAKTYFNHTRQWLYQRINGNIVDGKKRRFTDEQIKMLNFALRDISKKIGLLFV
jgi:hypothetical protein